MLLEGSSRELLVLLLFVSSLNAAVINLKKGDACSNACSGKENIFKYEDNKIYIYKFISRHSIKNPNSNSETLQLELQGKAQVSKITACDFGLTLSDVQLIESLKENSAMNKKYEMMKTMLEKYPLRFGYDDGRVTGVCQDNMDNEFAVNIKRGILSSLQVSIDSLETPNYLTETDIAGDCITEYVPKAEPPNFVQITKKKSIAGCSRKNKYFTTLTGRMFDKPQENRNVALLDGEYKCEIKIKIPDGLKESICEESHIFKPFGGQVEGSKIVINQELRFDSIIDGKIMAKVPTTRSDLTMNHGDKKPWYMTKKIDNPKPIVQEICKALQQKEKNIKMTQLFLNLIRSLTETSYEEIKALDAFINSDSTCTDGKSKAKNILIDALTNVKSDASFKFLIEDAKIYKLSRLGISIFNNPTSTMISILAKKLDDTSAYNSVTTILSSMIKSFCDSTPGCMLNPDIVNVMNAITKTLGSDCGSTDKSSRSKVLYSLRAIGNAGSHPQINNMLKTIQACIAKDTNSDDVKVFSVQAVRQFPCNEDVDKFLWSVYEDISKNSELRIEAYLSLIRCPTKATFDKILRLLESEQSQQLGSFVWSHISNLMETADRFKTDLRDMLQSFTDPINSLERKFNLDFRSYSKNIEKTFQRGYSGAKIDANVIFSSSSPIPSSVNINTTIDIFGRSINLFEIGIRGKGLKEKLFEGWLKPEAHTNVHPDIMKMDQKINKPAEKLSVSMYTKFMGREIYFNPNVISDVVEAMIKSSKSISFDRSLLLLDSTVSVASISGFPIELQIESTASIDFGLTKVDPLTLSSIDLSARLNAGVQVSGKLIVNAHCTKIGIQSKGLLARDMELGGKWKIKNDPSGDLSDYEFELNKIPDNSKLFSISNELSLIHKLQKVEMAKSYVTKFEQCTGQGMLKIMGVKVCASLKEAPKYSSYLSNIKADVTIEKFSGLRVLWKKESSEKPVTKLKSLIFSVSFPGAKEDTFRFKIEKDSNIKRQMYEVLLWNKWIYLKYEINDKKITGELKSGITEAKLSGSYQDKGMLTSEMNVDIKSDKDTGKFTFSHKFTKTGADITIKITKNGEKGFTISSKTTLQRTDHKTLNKFERLRHTTVLKYFGENEMSFLIETSKGNIPPTEVKSKLEIFWTTKSIRNVYIRQNYNWETLSITENDKTFGEVRGNKTTFNLDHEIEVKSKKFNVTNNLEIFTSQSMGEMRKQPHLMYIKFKREDVLKKEIVFETSTIIGADISRFSGGKYLLESGFNFQKYQLSRQLKSLMTWKLNQLSMVDLNAEVIYSKFFEIYFKHMFTSTQKGTTSLELKVVDRRYMVSSELNLPKNHALTIVWPENELKIDSEVNAESLSPFNVVVNHKMQLNKKLIARIINTVQFNGQAKELKFSSTAKNENNENIFDIQLDRKLSYDISKTRVFYDYVSNTLLIIPKWDVDHRIKIEQFADIDIDGQINFKEKTFLSKFVVENIKKKETKPKYGYEVVVSEVVDTIPYRKVKSVVFTGTTENSVTVKYGMKGYNGLFGVFVDLKNKVVTELMYKINVKGNTANMSMTCVLDTKTNPEYNFYLKRNLFLNWEGPNTYTANLVGEYGKGKKDPDMISYKMGLKFVIIEWSSLDFDVSLNCPKSCASLSNVNFVLSYSMDGTLPKNFLGSFKSIIKWQKTGSRTANYYDFQSNLNYDGMNKKTEYDLVLTKDTSTDKIISIKANMVSGIKYEISAKLRQKFADLILTINSKDNNNKEIKFLLKTSHESMKKISSMIEYKSIDKTNSLAIDFELNSGEKIYNLKITKIKKFNYKERFEFVETLEWKSNIPYIESGTGNLGLLMQGKTFQCNVNVVYSKKKVIDLKIQTSDVLKDLYILLETNMRMPFKYFTKYNLKSGEWNYEFDVTYDNKFFRITKMNLTYKMDGKTCSSTLKTMISTQIIDKYDIEITKESYVDYKNILSSFTSNSKMKLNGKVLASHKIDLPKGSMNFVNDLAKYTNLKVIPDFELSLQYLIRSVRDFSVSYNLKIDNQKYSELSVEYFRMQKMDSGKKIDMLGEALFYLNIEVTRQSLSGKMTAFIDKNKKNGIVKMKADIPQLKMKFDELTMAFEVSKESAGTYSGTVKYKNSNYMFTYKVYDGYKREMEMKATSKDAQPQEVSLAFDFTKNYLFKLSFDKYFVLDLNIAAIAKMEYSGNVKFIYKGEEQINIMSKYKATVPVNIKSFSDYVSAVAGVNVGLDVQLKIEGKILKKTMKSDFRLYHLHSELYKGGTKSYYNWDFNVKGDTAQAFFLMFSFDRNLPQFNYEEKILYTLNGAVKLKNKVKLVSEIAGVFVVDGDYMYDDLTLRIIAKNDKEMAHGYFAYKTKTAENGYGLQIMKETYETSLFYSNLQKNCTLKTNLGYMIKASKNYEKSEVWPVGKTYYVSAVDSKTARKCELKMERKKPQAAELTLNSNWNFDPTTVTCNVYYDTTSPDNTNIGLEIKGTFTNANIKNFDFKSTIKYPSSLNTILLSTNVNIDKSNVADMTITLKSTNGNSPYSLNMKYKGTHIITATAEFDTIKLKFKHSIKVNDGKFKTELWSCSSKCSIKSEFDCNYIHTNKAREIKVAVIWTKKYNVLEFMWNKKKELGFLLSCARKKGKTFVTISTPIRTLDFTREARTEGGTKTRKYTIGIVRKADPSKPVNFTVDISKEGTFTSYYNMDINVKTNLIHKGLKLSINRTLNQNVVDLYSINVKASFENEVKPFFTLYGTLRRVSPNNFFVKMLATNYDKFLNLTAMFTFSYEKIKIEYKVTQNENKEKEFVFKFIPFKKIQLTNKKDFEILCARTDYQYGYRQDIVLKLGQKGPNIVAYSTLKKSPLKYYAEVSGDGKKFVADFRPVGDQYIGDVYRKISGKKVQDLKLMMKLDPKSILTTTIYWNPKFVDALKTFLQDIMKPENLKSILTDAYDNSENRISTFTSDLKLKLIRNINGPVSVEFVKGIANDAENIPNIVAATYEDDDLYMKTMMDNLRSFLQQRDISKSFDSAKNTVKMSTESISKTFYDLFIGAKWYGVVYNPMKDTLDSITYLGIKKCIETTMNCVKYIAANINSQIMKIGNKLDMLSERAKSVSVWTWDLHAALLSNFKGSTVGQMVKLLGEVGETMIEGLSQVLQTEFIKQRITYYKDTIENVKELATMTKDMTNKMLTYVRSSNVVTTMVETIELIRSLKYKEAFINMIKPSEARMEMDLEKGTMETKLYVPPIIRPVYKMWKTMSDWFPAKMISRLQGSGVSGKLLSVFYRYEYLIFNYRTLKSLQNLLPPFKRSAWVLNGNSILTYDGASIRIGSGQCSYLLARDSTFGSFTLMMHIKADGKPKEFELIYFKKISILSSGEVKVDGKLVDILPTVIKEKNKSIEIFRDYDMTKIKTSEGLIVKYFKNLDYLKIVLTGDWHGKVKGLLGSNDFDVYNDLATAAGVITSDAGKLSKSWSIDTCRGNTKTGLYAIHVNPKNLRKCMDLFSADSMSYLSRCFTLIDPEPYLNLCQISLQYQAYVKDQFEKVLCDLSRNYVVRCKTQGLQIRLKPSCVTCGNVNLGKETTKVLATKDLKFNYIFIIEQSDCLLPYNSLMKNLFESMSLEKNNIYTLMSYNGESIFKDSHFKSINNEINTKSEDFRKLLLELKSSTFWNKFTYSYKSTEGSQAIFDAIKMPSKPGYMEKIVFFGCTACSEHKKHIFSNLGGLLKNSGISLTYVTAQPFTGYGSKSGVVGLGNDLMYFFEKDTLQSKTWLKDFQAPSDTCSNLAALQGGSVWSLSSMNSEMRRRRVADALVTELKKVNGRPKQRCSCGTGNYEEGREECKVSGLV